MRKFMLSFKRSSSGNDGGNETLFTISCTNQESSSIVDALCGDYKKVENNKFSNGTMYLIFDGNIEIITNEDGNEEKICKYGAEFVLISNPAATISAIENDAYCIENLISDGRVFTANDEMQNEFPDDALEFSLNIEVHSPEQVGTIESKFDWGADGMSTGNLIMKSVCSVYKITTVDNNEPTIIEYPIYYIANYIDGQPNGNTIYFTYEYNCYVISHYVSNNFQYIKENYGTTIFGEYMDPGNSFGDNGYVRIIEK